MRYMLILLLLALTSRSNAADYAVILNDQEKAALLEVLDQATKAYGLSIAVNTLYLSNKIKSAPVVTDQKDDPEPPKEKQQ